jgi:hypothetical protein
MLRCPSRGTLEEAICLAVHSGAASSGACFPAAASFAAAFAVRSCPRTVTNAMPSRRRISTRRSRRLFRRRCRFCRQPFDAWLRSPPVWGRVASGFPVTRHGRPSRDAWLEGMSQGYVAGVTVKHPTERGSEGRTLFDRAAEAASNFSSSPMFFTLCGLLVAAWAASYLLGQATPCTTCSPMPWPRLPCCS